MEPSSFPVLPRIAEIPDQLDVEISRRLLSEVSAARSTATLSALKGATGALKALASLHEPGFFPEKLSLEKGCIRELRHGDREYLSFVGRSSFLSRVSPEGAARLESLVDGRERSIPLSDRRSEEPVFSRVSASPPALFSGYADGELRVHCLTSGALVFKHRVDGAITGASMSADGSQLAFAYSERRYLDDHVLRFGMTPTKPMRDGVGTIDIYAREDTMYGERWCRKANYCSRYGEDGYLRDPAFSGGYVIAAAKDKIYRLPPDGSSESKLHLREPGLGTGGTRISRLESTANGAMVALSTGDDVVWYGDSFSFLAKVAGASCFALNGAAPQLATCDAKGALELHRLREGSLETFAEALLPCPVDSLTFSPNGKGLLARSSGVSFLIFDHPELHSS